MVGWADSGNASPMRSATSPVSGSRKTRAIAVAKILVILFIEWRAISLFPWHYGCAGDSKPSANMTSGSKSLTDVNFQAPRPSRPATRTLSAASYSSSKTGALGRFWPNSLQESKPPLAVAKNVPRLEPTTTASSVPGTKAKLRSVPGSNDCRLPVTVDQLAPESLDKNTPTAVIAMIQAARIIAMTAVGVFLSSDSGANWSTVTGNLQSFDPGTLRSLAFVPGTDDAVVVGSNRGTFFATASGGFDSWSEFGQNLPNAPVFELEYDAADNVLVAGLLGRGAWKFTSVSDFDPDGIFADGFESPAQP